jgi:hypothetical protein
LEESVHRGLHGRHNETPPACDFVWQAENLWKGDFRIAHGGLETAAPW